MLKYFIVKSNLLINNRFKINNVFTGQWILDDSNPKEIVLYTTQLSRNRPSEKIKTYSKSVTIFDSELSLNTGLVENHQLDDKYKPGDDRIKSCIRNIDSVGLVGNFGVCVKADKVDVLTQVHNGTGRVFCIILKKI